MPRFDATNAELFVFTFKEGVLSAVGHDLKLGVGRFDVQLDGDRIEAQADSASLEVVCARKAGVDAHGLLPVFAFDEIRKRLQTDILKATEYPTIRFVGRQTSSHQFEGQLTVLAVTQSVVGSVRQEQSLSVAELQLDQRQFGMTPFRGLLGSLRVKPVVSVQLRARVAVASAATPGRHFGDG